MRFRNTKVGDVLTIGGNIYEVKAVYRHHVKTENITTKQIECFTFGDLVMAGKESGQP